MNLSKDRKSIDCANSCNDAQTLNIYSLTLSPSLSGHVGASVKLSGFRLFRLVLDPWQIYSKVMKAPLKLKATLLFEKASTVVPTGEPKMKPNIKITTH